ncbi:MAG: DNRLRE domain-containing protein, partial [Caldilineales bacterium]|nr:DNRLRE domain-containing protein [Caldilineales bacterium]
NLVRGLWRPLLLLGSLAIFGGSLILGPVDAGPPQAPVMAAPADETPIPRAYCRGVYHGDTATGSTLLDHYACRPDWPETGPEHFYRLHTTTTQALTLILSHGPGIDLDLFLLEHEQPDRCHAADATLQLSALPPGWHLIVVDGFAGSQGPYTLVVDCDEPPFATPTPTDTPPPAATPTPTPILTATPTPTRTPTRPRLSYDHFLPAQRHRHPPPTPQPITLILQPGREGYDGLADSYLSAWAPTENYANLDRLALRQPDIMAPVLRFRLDGLPAQARIVEARLSLWVLSRSNDNPATTGAYPLHRPWRADQVTWQQATADVPWTQPGANGIPADRGAVPLSVQTVTETGRWYDWDLTPLAQAWVADPTTNHGVILKALDVPRVLYTFAAAEYPNPAARPRLLIRYWTPTPPAPSQASPVPLVPSPPP